MQKVIVDEPNRKIIIKWDKTRFGIVRYSDGLPNGFDAQVFNPREALEVRDFINNCLLQSQKNIEWRDNEGKTYGL